MRIANTMKSVIFLIAGFMLTYIAFSVYFNHSIETGLEDLKTSVAGRNLFDQLQDTTDDYFLYRMERADQQWRMIHGELLRFLNDQKYLAFQKRHRAEDLRGRLQLMGKSFNKLTTAAELRNGEASQEFLNRLMTQITLTAGEIGASFDDITRKIGDELLSLQRLQSLMDLIALISVALLIVGVSFFLSKRVVQPVLALHNGAEIIGRGNLDYQVGITSQDEIGGLSQAFDRMTANLRQITVSRDELMKEAQERQRAEAAMWRSKERLILLAETAGQLLGSVSPQRVVDSICPRVMEFLECDVFFNFLVDHQDQRLHLNACAGIPDEEMKRIEWLDYGVAVCGCAAQEGCRIVVEDILNTEDARTNLVKSYGVQAYACHPLQVEGRVLGTLSFGSRNRPRFTEDELMLMKAIADQVAIAMDRKLAEEALRRAHDGLELQVSQRTEDLRLAVENLQEEVTERQQAETALRKSEQNLRYLASRILTAQEQERKRVAIELHEGLAQSMTTLKLCLRTIQQHAPARSKDLKEDFDAAHNLLRDMIEDIHRICQGLSPVLLETLGLPAALNHLFGELSKFQKVTMNLDIDAIQDLFAPQTEINVFRIFQESLNNIARHAQATQVSVAIKRQNGRVNFSIKDNGVGFDPKRVARNRPADKAMGLAAMDERLRMIGALLQIKSQPGIGTEISFSLPIDAV